MAPALEIEERLAVGDRNGAATVALQELGPGVLRYLRATIRDQSQADEAFSQFAENLWRGIGGYRGDASMRTWALGIARNVVRDQRTEPWRRRSRRLETSEAERLADGIRRTSGIELEQHRRELEILRQSLSEDEQVLLVLRMDQELTWEEISGVLSDEATPTSPGAQMKRFERLRHRLKVLALERGLVE